MTVNEMLSTSTWRDYYTLCKPRVVLLMLLTAYVGMQLAAPGKLPWLTVFFGLLGIGLMASAAAVVNHLVDYRIDAIMARTKYRPIPAGKITATKAIIFAAILGLIGFIILLLLVNTLTALLTFFTLLGYAVIYTMYLKRNTPQNIVLGGLAGAMPPMLGWTAISGSFDPNSLLLVAIIFIWTPPHFWALAIFRHTEYAKVENIPMLPITHGIEYTKTHVLLYTGLLLVVGWLPYIVGASGIIYFIGSTILGVIFLYYAIRLKLSSDVRWGQRTFRYSIVYLALLFIVLLVDHVIYYQVGV
ncbi:MAG: heme o synthase [Gammaproteobacteria bacterium]|nr:heme o synthase [Gammaproteobacteria bacterium]